MEMNAEALCNQLRDDWQIEITVGQAPSSETFEVSKLLLEEVSQFFINALKPHTKEGREGRMTFPEDDVESWKILIHWIFKRRLPSVEIRDPDVDYTRFLDQLTRCWILGDKYDMAAFQNATMTGLLTRLATHRPSIDTLKFAVDGTSRGSKLRHLMMEEAVLAIYRYRTATPDVFDEVTSHGSLKGFLATARAFETVVGIFDHRIDRVRFNTCPHWTDYMVSSGPVRT